MNLTCPAPEAEVSTIELHCTVSWNGSPFLVTHPVIRKNRIVRTKIVPPELVRQYNRAGWPRNLVLMREYSIALIGDDIKLKIVTNADEAEDELPELIQTIQRDIGTYRDGTVIWRGRAVRSFISVSLIAPVCPSLDEAELAPSPLTGQPALSIQHYRVLESLMKSGIILRNDRITDALTPDERLLVNLLIAQHSDRPPRPLSLAEIGRFLGVSDESVRRRRESLFRTHPHLKRAVAAFRAPNSKAPNPDAIRGTAASADDGETVED